MKQFQKIQWIAFALILILGLVGCEMLAPDGRVGPTAPVDVSSDPANLANFWVGRGQNKFGVYTSSTVLQLQIPEGSFLVKYVTLSGIYYVVLSSEEGAFLAIGLLAGDELVDVSLWEVPISDTATPDPDASTSPDEGVLIYYWPGSTGVTWETVVVFMEIDWSAEIIIIKDGKIFDNPDFVIVKFEQVEAEAFNITSEIVAGTGIIAPPSYSGIPAGASRSIKFIPYPQEVLVNNNSVMPVQHLGNGNGHLVIHDIRENIHIRVWF